MPSDRQCSEDDCDRPSRSRGWCQKHYNKFRRLGQIEDLYRPCRVESCERAVVALDVCCAHYTREYRSIPLPDSVPIMTPVQKNERLHRIHPYMRYAPHYSEWRDLK